MRCHKVVVAIAAVAILMPPPSWGQDTAQMAAQQAQLRAMVEQIARERPPQAEAAARELLRRAHVQQQILESLLVARSRDQYWQEVAQLTVQQQMLQQVQDSARRQLMAEMFGEEARIRALQRDFRDAGREAPAPIFVVDGKPVDIAPTSSAQTASIRERLEELLTRHFAAEDSLRSLEIADVERRLVQIRAETERRRRERAELVRQQVEQILREAKPPE